MNLDWIALSIFLIALLPRLNMGSKVGMTWDEGLYALCGCLAIKNVISRDFSKNAWGFEFHPPLMMYLFGMALGIYSLVISVMKYSINISMKRISEMAVSSFSGKRGLIIVRLPNIILGSLTSVLIYYLSMDIWSSREIGILAALILAFLPMFIAWSSLAMLEGGVSFFFALTMLTFERGFAQNGLVFFYIAVSGISLGMAFASREFGYFIPLTTLPWLLVDVINKNFVYADVINEIIAYIIWIVLGIITFYILWPFLWGSPLKQFKKTIGDISKMASKGRWNFFLNGFLATSPLILFLIAIIGIFEIIDKISMNISSLFIFSWFIIPLIVTSLPIFPKRGGIYEMTFIMPSFAIIVAVGTNSISKVFVKISQNIFSNISGAMLTVGPAALLLLLVLLSVIKIAPYYMDYYNSYGRYLLKKSEFLIVPFGWWGEGMDAALEFIDENADPNSTVWIYGPKATALYHSKRVNLLKTADENLFYLRKQLGYDIKVDKVAYKWRIGDLKFFFPYYHQDRLCDIEVEKIRKDYGADYVVIYRWALQNPANTGLNSANYTMINHIQNNMSPIFVSKIKNETVCWVYRL